MTGENLTQEFKFLTEKNFDEVEKILEKYSDKLSVHIILSKLAKYYQAQLVFFMDQVATQINEEQALDFFDLFISEVRGSVIKLFNFRKEEENEL